MGRLLSLFFLILFVACAPSSTAKVTSASAGSGKLGVLLMAHGGGKEWNAGVLESVAPLRAKYEIEVAFGMADAASLKESVQKLEARGIRKIAVVRLFVSGESFTERTEQIFGLKPGAPATEPPADPHAAHHGGHGDHSMAFYRVASSSQFALSSEGLVDAQGMGAVLADRAMSMSKDPSKEDVIILAHGPGDDDENARWLAKLNERAAVIKARAPFRRVQVETLREDWPEKRVEAEKRIRAFVERAPQEGGGKAIVIPFRVQGFGPYAEVLKDLPYEANKVGLIPHAEVTKWIESQIIKLESGQFRSPS